MDSKIHTVCPSSFTSFHQRRPTSNLEWYEVGLRQGERFDCGARRTSSIPARDVLDGPEVERQQQHARDEDCA